MNAYPMIPMMKSNSSVFRNWIFFFASALWAATICLPRPAGNGPDDRVVGIVGVRVDEDVLEFLFWQELGHGLCKHGLTRTRAPDHHDMPALDRGLLDDFDRTLLADHLVDQFCRDLDLEDAPSPPVQPAPAVPSGGGCSRLPCRRLRRRASLGRFILRRY